MCVCHHALAFILLPSGMGGDGEARALHLLRRYAEGAKPMQAKGIHKRYIRRIPPARNQHMADTRHIMACIEGPLSLSQKNLEPRAEITGIAIRLHPDIRQIAGAIARGNVHAAA